MQLPVVIGSPRVKLSKPYFNAQVDISSAGCIASHKCMNNKFQEPWRKRSDARIIHVAADESHRDALSHPRGQSEKSSWHAWSRGEASKRFECLAKKQIFNGVRWNSTFRNSCSCGEQPDFLCYQPWPSVIEISGMQNITILNIIFHRTMHNLFRSY